MAPPENNDQIDLALDGPSLEDTNVEEPDDSQIDTPLMRDEAKETEDALKKLEAICSVLGVNYKSKIAEFGSVLNSKRVEEYLNFLKATRDDNFNQLKIISGELIRTWKCCNTEANRVEKFAWILSIQDAENADDVRARNLLSTGSVNKANSELANLKKASSNKVKSKYFSKKKKLMRMLYETHLTGTDVDFDANKTVNAEDYECEKLRVKNIIRRVKLESVRRKELVIRVEMIKRAVSLKFPLEEIEALVARAEKIAQELDPDNQAESIRYDGRTIEEVLTNLRQDAVANPNAQAQESTQVSSGCRSDRTIHLD